MTSLGQCSFAKLHVLKSFSTVWESVCLCVWVCCYCGHKLAGNATFYASACELCCCLVFIYNITLSFSLAGSFSSAPLPNLLNRKNLAVWCWNCCWWCSYSACCFLCSLSACASHDLSRMAHYLNFSIRTELTVQAAAAAAEAGSCCSLNKSERRKALHTF